VCAGVSIITITTCYLLMMMVGWMVLFAMWIGAAATLLATAFESWMVTEHHSRGYPSHLLAATFRMATWGIGLATIVSGFAAEASVKGMGLLAPFNLAIGVSFCSLSLYDGMGWVLVKYFFYTSTTRPTCPLNTAAELRVYIP